MDDSGAMKDSAKPLQRVVLGLTGGIAAYKAAELTRLLVKEGIAVDVVMTEAATRFIAARSETSRKVAGSNHKVDVRCELPLATTP